MSDEQPDMTKRERQKARRAARLEREREQAQAQRRNRVLSYVLVGAVVLAGIGFLVQRQFAARSAQDALAAQVAASLDELGCTADERQPDLGGSHIDGQPAQLIAAAPDAIYPSRPPTSGDHLGQVVASGVYDDFIDERIIPHNMEHGYVVAWYDPDAPAEQIEALKAWGQEQLDGDRPKTLVIPYYGPFGDDQRFVFTAWHFRQACRDFDADVAQVFSDAHHGTAGEGPERGVPAHNPGAQGVLAPEGGDLLLPPLDTLIGGDGASEASTEGAGDPDASPTPSSTATGSPTASDSPTAAATDGTPTGTGAGEPTTDPTETTPSPTAS